MSLVLAICLLCHYIDSCTAVTSILGILPFGICFVYLGIMLRPLMKQINKRKYQLLALSGFMLLGGLYINLIQFGNQVDLSSMNLGIWPVYVFCSLCGTVVVLSVSHITNNSFLQYVGRNSLYIYGMHYCVIGLIDKICTGFLCAVITLLICIPIAHLYGKIRTQYHYIP